MSSSSSRAVTRAGPEHLQAWLDLRKALWPDASADEHGREIDRQLCTPQRHAGFVAIAADGRVCGLAEASIRRDHVNGCGEPPVAFLEGVYVSPDARRQGWAARLLAAIEAWGLERGCRELGSDAGLANVADQAAHLVWGFEETESTVFFRKTLQP